MSKQKKRKNKKRRDKKSSSKISIIQIVALATAIINLISKVLDIVKDLVN